MTGETLTPEQARHLLDLMAKGEGFDEGMDAGVALTLADIALQIDQPERAEALIAHAIQLAKETEDHEQLAWALLTKARIVNIISTSVREPIPNIGLSNTLRGAMASWAKSLSQELPASITINNVLPGFTDTGRLDSLANSIHEKTGRSKEDIHDTWMSQVPIGRLIDPMETASAITFLCLPQSGGIRGVSLAVDGGRMRSI